MQRLLGAILASSLSGMVFLVGEMAFSRQFVLDGEQMKTFCIVCVASLLGYLLGSWAIDLLTRDPEGK